MPYLYLLIVHHKTSPNQNPEMFQKLFDMIFKQVINIISVEEK
jgi:hypothetical protein